MNFRLLLIIIFILLTGLIGFYLVWPEYQQLLTVQSGITETQDKIKTVDQRLADLKDVYQKLDQYKDQLRVLDYALPNKTYLPHLYDFFEIICPQRGLILSDVNITAGQPGDFNIKEITVNLSVSGSYSLIKDFLSYLESSVRFFAIENINLSSSEKPGEPLGLRLSLKAYTR